MSEEDKKVPGRAPKARVDTAEERGPEPEPQVQAQVADQEGEVRPQEPKRGLSDGARAARAWLHRSFPGHENAVVWGFIGLIVAILIFIVGFWRTLFVALVVAVGVAFGQYLDGDPKIWRALKGIFNDNRS